ncbi:MAG: hypothetical protein IPG39_14005 [Bacteroidetes bacterium]|nr:hypothetical protein [Bacteroidota bacterium]
MHTVLSPVDSINAILCPTVLNTSMVPELLRFPEIMKDPFRYKIDTASPFT